MVKQNEECEVLLAFVFSHFYNNVNHKARSRFLIWISPTQIFCPNATESQP